MIKREISEKIIDYTKKYPVVTITGPRQSGKTTLCKNLFPNKVYLSLEDPDTRSDARNDPRTFLEEHVKKGYIIDEVQKFPELLSYIQGIVDEKDKPGLFILTGSQNFELLNTISQTLAGRTALATLLPFSYSELYKNKKDISIEKIIYKGFYPRIHDKKLNPTEALAFYVNTYIERDVRSLINVKELSKFELFLKLCASRTGQILNLSNLGNECGINHNTAHSWLSVLEASYVIHLVRPHYKNFSKRLVKSPKLYFMDVGLACYLLDIDNQNHVKNHPLKGALFETFVVSEILKSRLNQGKRSNLFYFRDNTGNEVDLILDYGNKFLPIEIKSGKTLASDLTKGLMFYKKINPKNCLKGQLIYGGELSHTRAEIDLVSFRDLHTKVF